MVTVKKGDKSIEFEAEKEDRITHSQTDESHFKREELERKKILN